MPPAPKEPPDSVGAVPLLVEGPADSGVPHAVIEPRLYFENLLLPFVAETVRAEGVLRYPLPGVHPDGHARPPHRL